MELLARLNTEINGVGKPAMDSWAGVRNRVVALGAYRSSSDYILAPLVRMGRSNRVKSPMPPHVRDVEGTLVDHQEDPAGG